MTIAIETTTTEPGLEALLRGAEDRSSFGPEWLQALRREALGRFAATGLPSVRHEEFRYTNLARIARATFAPAMFAPATFDGVAGEGLPEIPEAALFPHAVFAAGRPELRPSTPLPDGVRLERLSDLAKAPSAPQRSHALLDLNTASHDDALVLTIARGVRVAEPVRFAHLSAGRTASHPRLHVVLEEGAEATLLDVFASAGSPYTNSVVLVSLAAGAILRHVRVQDESRDAFHTGLVAVDAGRGSRYLSHAFGFGGALSRHEIDVRLLGEGAEALLDGLFVAFGAQSSDQHLAVTHAAPRTSSRQRYRGILGGEARGAFDGKVVVAKGATHTEAHQMNRNLLLSGTATVDSKPQLEIENNDVKASHASTTGRLNEAALFYLRARGIGEAEARALLTRAFASEIISGGPVPELVPLLEGIVTASLGGPR